MDFDTCMLIACDDDPGAVLRNHPTIDRVASQALAASLFPDEKLKERSDRDLLRYEPTSDEVMVAVRPGLTIISTPHLGTNTPSTLPERFRLAVPARRTCLHLMRNSFGFLAFAVWDAGTLRRSLSVHMTFGPEENIGPHLPFEEPFWAGQRPFEAPEGLELFPLPFWIEELGDAALADMLGGAMPAELTTMRLKHAKPWWRF